MQMITNIAALVFNIGLNLLLIPRYGIVGAAVSWALAIAGFNIIRVLLVNHILGMIPWSRGLGKGLVAGAISFGLAMLLREHVHGLVQVALVSILILAVYALIVRVMGLDADDRLILRTLWSRLRGRKPALS
jgi:O-antigen/teichoic acid export membrane protein